MNSQRAQSYGRVVKTLNDLAGAKLNADEQQIVRDAADALFFCEDLQGDRGAESLLATFYEMVDRLTDSERLLPETAGRLVADVEGCGPFAPVA